jgi:hypothetical protein
VPVVNVLYSNNKIHQPDKLLMATFTYERHLTLLERKACEKHVIDFTYLHVKLHNLNAQPNLYECHSQRLTQSCHFRIYINVRTLYVSQSTATWPGVWTVHEYSNSSGLQPAVQAPPAVKKKNSMVLVRERTIPTERPPLFGEVSANFCR